MCKHIPSDSFLNLFKRTLNNLFYSPFFFLVKFIIPYTKMNVNQKMKTFQKYFAEGYMVQYIRDKDQDVLKLKNTDEKSWVEVRGKKNYEVTYDRNDPMHKAIDGLGKAANISDLMNGEVVYINPNHPHAKKALDTIKKQMK